MKTNTQQLSELALFIFLVVGCGAAWIHLYVLPHDQMREATNACIEESGKDRSKEVWRTCWEQEAKTHSWVWSETPPPKRQAYR